MSAGPQGAYTTPIHDAARLAAVQRTGLLDAAADELWDGLTTLAARLLVAPMAFMTMVDEHRSFWLSTAGVDTATAGRQNTVEESFCQYVITDRAPLFIGDAAADPRTRTNPSVTGMGVRAWAGFPVLDSDGNALGSFCVLDTEPRTWSRADQLNLGALADVASRQVHLWSAVVAERAARDELEALTEDAALQVAQIAEALQQSLLTRPAGAPDLDIAVRYLPSAVAAQVGGDWFDAFVTSSGATIVSVGDVTGHDRAAAGVMAQLRNVLRGLAVDSDDMPAALLHRLDSAISTFEMDTLASAVVARIEPADDRDGHRHRLHWSNAGHLPPMLVGPDGQVQILDKYGDLLLGHEPSRARHDHAAELPVGATLVIATDGLVERRDEDIDDGLGRLRDALAAAPRLDPEALCDHLLAAMLSDTQSDDVALVVLRALPPAPPDPDVDPSGTGTSDFVAELPVEQTISAVARDLVRAHAKHLPDDIVGDAVLLVSELTSNAVRYGKPPVTLRLRTTERGLRADISDCEPQLPVFTPGLVDPSQPSGRGLFIVSALADEWGIEPTHPGPGKTVWFQIQARADPATPVDQ